MINLLLKTNGLLWRNRGQDKIPSRARRVRWKDRLPKTWRAPLFYLPDLKLIWLRKHQTNPRCYHSGKSWKMNLTGKLPAAHTIIRATSQKPLMSNFSLFQSSCLAWEQEIKDPITPTLQSTSLLKLSKMMVRVYLFTCKIILCSSEFHLDNYLGIFFWKISINICI